MRKLIALILFLCSTSNLNAQTIETVYLNPNAKDVDFYTAVVPEKVPIKAFMFLLDGFGASPDQVLIQTNLPKYAAQQGILTVLPVLKTGSLYFGVDSASQASLKEQIISVVEKYKLQDKDFYIGGFSIGGSCAVKYAQLAYQNKSYLSPKAIFAIDPPLDWERFYNGAKRMVRLSEKDQLNSEVSYMIDRIEKEMKGSPENSIAQFYKISPYSFSDPKQTAVKLLVNTPIMLIAEPDINWWLTERGYDYSYFNSFDHMAMINELRRLGNKNAVLISTVNKGYRKPELKKHPHSWSIADEQQVVKWLFEMSKLH